MGVFVITLDDLRFHSRIGVAGEERLLGNSFIVNMAVTIADDNFTEEDINTTVSYADLYSIVEHEMARESLLLESVSRRIALAALDTFPQIMDVTVKITKIAPPIPGITGSASVSFHQKR